MFINKNVSHSKKVSILRIKQFFSSFYGTPCKIKVHFLKAMKWNILIWLPDNKQCSYFLLEILSNSNTLSPKCFSVTFSLGSDYMASLSVN